ncbi:cysteine-rich DPF motif domain-containing protein 1 isoform 4-T4 [Trichechus inunguis]
MRDGIRWHLRQSAVPRACLSASSVLCQLHTATWGRSPPTPALSYALSAETDFLQQLQRSLEGVCPEAPGSRESALSPPPGGELRPEGPLHRRQGQVPGPWLTMQCVQQAGVRGPGMQFILHQEILPPLCLGEHRCFPTGNPARRGQEESSGQDALRQAQFSDLRAARGQVGSPCTELWGTAAARARLLLSWRPWCLASFLGCVYSRGS